MAYGDKTYTPELANEICERIADGEFLRVICREEGKPSWTTIYNWMNDIPGFAERIAHARTLGFDAIAEDTICMIADTPEVGEKTKLSMTGLEVTRGDMIEHRKLRVDTRLKMLSKWAPKKYGDKQEVTHVVEDQSVQRLLEGVKRAGG